MATSAYRVLSNKELLRCQKYGNDEDISADYDSFKDEMEAYYLDPADKVVDYKKVDVCEDIDKTTCNTLKAVVNTIVSVIKNGYSEDFFRREDVIFSAGLAYEENRPEKKAYASSLPYFYIGASPLREGLEITARITDPSQKKRGICFIRHMMRTVSILIESEYIEKEDSKDKITERWKWPMGPWIVMDFKKGEHIKETAGYMLNKSDADITGYFFRRLMCPGTYPNEPIDPSVKKSIVSAYPNTDWVLYVRSYFCGMTTPLKVGSEPFRYTRKHNNLNKFLPIDTMDYVTSYKIHQKGLNFSPISQDLIIGADAKTKENKEFLFFCSSKAETFGSCFNMKNIDDVLKTYYDNGGYDFLLEQRDLCAKAGHRRGNGSCSELEVFKGIKGPAISIWWWLLCAAGVILVFLIIAIKMQLLKKIRALIASRRPKRE